jgi:hypothetical protein
MMRTAAQIIGIVVVAVLAIFGLVLLGGLLFGDSGPHTADRIIQQHYEACLAVGGSYRQGDGLDDFSCTGTGHP